MQPVGVGKSTVMGRESAEQDSYEGELTNTGKAPAITNKCHDGLIYKLSWSRYRKGNK